MDWIDLAQDKDQWRALVDTVMNFQVPYNLGKFLSSCTTGDFSRGSQLHEVSCRELVGLLVQGISPRKKGRLINNLNIRVQNVAHHVLYTIFTI
jgi:hypothetical protein